MRLHSIALATAALFSATTANAVDLILNGGFETGDYTGWSVADEGGGSGTFYVVDYSASALPDSGGGFAANAQGGQFFAVTDQTGPGSHSLTQTFTLASAGNVTIKFDLFANNYAGTDFANGRDFNTSPNQNAVVDLLVGGADPFTEAASDIISTLYGPGSDGPSPVYPWVSYSSTLGLAAGVYQLRFAETDNQLFFNLGVDNVSVTTGAVPEPASWALLIAGFGLVGGALRRRRALAAA